MNTLVTENSSNGKSVIDVYQKLSNDRILFIDEIIDDNFASDFVATLLLKDAENHDKITIFINSEGGDIRSCFMIYDILQLLKSPIETCCLGTAKDGALMLLSAGTKGKRFAAKNSKISFCQLQSEFEAQSNLSDAEESLNRLRIDNKELIQIMSKLTKTSTKKLNSDYDRRKYMTAQQAKKKGFIDKCLGGSNEK